MSSQSWPRGLFLFVSLLVSASVAPIAWAADAVKLELGGVIIQGAKPLKDDIAWVVEPIGKTEGAKQEAKGPTPTFSLVPGKYRVTGTLGNASVNREIDVRSAAKVVLDFNAGYARLAMIPARGAKPVSVKIHWEIYRYTKGGIDERAKVTEALEANPQFTLPNGFYTVRGRYEGVNSEMVIEIKAGILYKYTVNLYAGTVALNAVNGKGKAVKENVRWNIVRASKGKDGKRIPVASYSEASPSFLLREGKYVAVVSAGDLVGEAPFEIKMGKTRKVKVELKPLAAAAAAAGG